MTLSDIGKAHDLQRRLQRTNQPLNSRRQAAKQTEVDLETWAGLDKIKYEFDVTGTGEGIWGPVYFGRAYDSPPFFTHSGVAVTGFESGPRFTVGVSEWIRDEQDMYVGANLWVRLDSTFANEPRRSSEPCSEGPVIFGSNILKDPGFEFHFERVPIGPKITHHGGVPQKGMAFPGDGFGAGQANTGSLYWTHENIQDRLYYDVNGWTVWSNNEGAVPPATPELSTENPRSGTYHWRVSFFIGDGGSTETYPTPIGGSYCALKNGRIEGYSARCEEGNLVRYSAHVTVSDPFDGPFGVRVTITFFDKDSDVISGAFGPTPSLTTSYVKYEYSATAPPNTHTCVVEAEIENGSFPLEGASRDIHFDVDDCVLEVSHS